MKSVIKAIDLTVTVQHPSLGAASVVLKLREEDIESCEAAGGLLGWIRAEIAIVEGRAERRANLKQEIAALEGELRNNTNFLVPRA